MSGCEREHPRAPRLSLSPRPSTMRRVRPLLLRARPIKQHHMVRTRNPSQTDSVLVRSRPKSRSRERKPKAPTKETPIPPIRTPSTVTTANG
eukprot:113945-Chlamydomonas_euryale.AAC.5